MGAGGRTFVPPANRKSEADPLKRVPFEKPPFSLSQIKKAIPPHCFQRSVLRSFSYVIYDLTIAFCLYYVATHYFHTLPRPLSFLAWPIYWAVQGCILTGVWVIAHECGHHAFSDYQLLDDIVGLVLHSALLVPYFSWKYSHRRHHSNTGSLERDEVFVPKQKSGMKWYSKYLNNPLGRVLTLVITLTLGWPLYLAFNVSGRPYERFACHYDPYSYAAASLVITVMARNSGRRKSDVTDLVVTALDLVLMALLFSANGAACAVGVIAQKGNTHAQWMKVCDVFDAYCRHVTAALVLSIIGSTVFLLLVLHSVLKLHYRSRS